jgi:hypothetical protein
MTPTEKIIVFAEKHGAKMKKNEKQKQKALKISTATKLKELVIKIATDLGYLE